jgi:uncharacterized protein (DUF849 family)
MPKFILNCAVTGAIHTPTMAPYLPLKPKDIAAQAIEAVNAGASTVHIHGRNPEDGSPTGDTNIIGEIVSEIHAKCDGVICITTGGGLTMTVEQRMAAVPVFKPELASCNLGSLNFALFPVAKKFKEWKYDWEYNYLEGSKDFIFRNTFGDMEKVLAIMKEAGTKPEFEAYDVGHLHNAHYFYSQGMIDDPFYVQFVTGILGGIGSTIPHIVYLRSTLMELFGDKAVYSTIGAGRHEFPLGTVSMLLGGGVRVGLEDMVRIAGEFGYEPATPDETRAMLKLKGRDKVNM